MKFVHINRIQCPLSSSAYSNSANRKHFFWHFSDPNELFHSFQQKSKASYRDKRSVCEVHNYRKVLSWNSLNLMNVLTKLHCSGENKKMLLIKTHYWNSFQRTKDVFIKMMFAIIYFAFLIIILEQQFYFRFEWELCFNFISVVSSFLLIFLPLFWFSPDRIHERAKNK